METRLLGKTGERLSAVGFGCMGLVGWYGERNDAEARATVLEAIDREGSISGAGRALGMSYRRTWLLVDTMNRCWKEPLVEAIPGGGQQKGARLTPCGREVLAAYRTLEGQLAKAAADGALARLEALMLPAPRPSQHAQD